ncbi:beta-ketoacyl synthase, C-terminal domain protein [Burkholderia thailandensis MSMB121]|uniref:type I polyketide synthase n=1 Tax=Burkholderia humptydooensis TaxID=430531 RepID=UPI000327FECE|nr:type I polyketide synthase [Burkholderia humptydooensis]AGK49736.1 beta-ketoacyl synthase, C-terminal domain protein [Burkholderia thailandensis MSMB121]ATF33301.1 type I polyketide synthase [Burkholderia thailandensis]
MHIQPSDRDIAVIGMACRFPGASDPDEYWHNLVNGVESVMELGDAPSDRQTLPFAAPLTGDVLAFDAAFFGIGHRDAALMDPQHRLFLECAWHALEQSGIRPGRLPDTGLFAGGSSSAYLAHLQRSELMEKFQPSAFELQITNDKDYLVSRTAWHLGIEGPVLGVQAACATSLVAVAEAVEALRAGRCRTALAGACTVRFPQRVPYQAQQGMVYSRNGHCMPFSSNASGTVFGSGVAVVVLKPLRLALVDGDRVLAVIKGCAVNNDGARKVSFTTTSVDGQRRLISQAMKDANLVPSAMRAMEAHGTGTIAGDPIEFDALNELFATGDVAPRHCALGAVKANVGHLETCAGMAGLIKAVLQIQHGWIAPQIHIDEVNPSIALDGSPFYFPTYAERWESTDPRTAIGVSAFGIGGTNTHVLLARPPLDADERPPAPAIYPSAVPVSGQSEAACHRLIQTYRSDLSALPIDTLAWSAQTTRRPLRYRATLLAGKDGMLHVGEEVRDSGRRAPHVVFQFPGQGSQFLGMATGLAQSNARFATVLRELVSLLRDSANVDISLLLHGSGGAGLTDTATAQPALVAVQIAMARFLMQHGIVPDAVVGHSLGEIAGACIAGVLTDEHALLFAARRGRLISALPPGSMLAVSMSEEACQDWLAEDVSLAAVNGKESCVLSGTVAAIQRVQASLSARGVRCRALSVSHAFHSSMMDPALAELALAAPAPSTDAAGIRFHSTLLGSELASMAQLDRDYWARHAREPVRFMDAIQSIPVREGTVFVEVGPGTTLTALTMALREKDIAVRTMRAERDESQEHEIWHGALQKLWTAGVDLDWRPSWDNAGTAAPLPHYPFDRTRHGIAADTDAAGSPPPEAPVRRPASREYETLDAAAAALWEKATGVAPSDPHRQFSDDGGDSLSVIKLVALADSELGVMVSVPNFMRAPTPTGLRACLVEAGAAKAIRTHR